jgi:diadenosine tetraphosphate (Ap4A) HIT family hydrolase
MPEHIFLQTPTLTASLANAPTTRGHVLITLTTQLFTPPTNTNTTKPILETTCQIAHALCQITGSKRCALAYDGDLLIHLLPLHGLSEEKWTPMLDNDKEFHTEFPGYLSTKSGPPLANKDLDEMRDRIAAYSGLTEKEEGYDKSFHGENNDSNLFARIIRGEITEQWRIWESPSHVAFLTPFANTPGYTVLVPRKHTSSDIFSLAPDDYNALAVDAACSVSALLKKALGLDMCGMFFEGLEIDYSHVKLVPVHTSKKLGEPLREEFRELYRGSVSTKLGLTKYPEEELQRMNSELRARFEV